MTSLFQPAKTGDVARPVIIVDLSLIKYEFESFLLAGEFDLFEDGRILAKMDGYHATAEFSFGKLILSCWGDGWARSWRVISCELSPERLTLECAKQMGVKRCSLTLSRGVVDRQAAQARKDFARKLSAMIEANLAGVRVERAVAARNDRRHLSGLHVRLVIRDRGRRWAGIGVSDSEVQASIDTALAYGITWLDELRRRSGSVDGLMIFAPRCDTIAIRLTGISDATRVALFRINEVSGAIEPATPFDQGDLNDSFRKAARRAHWPRPGMLPPDCAMLVDSVRRLAPDHLEAHHRGPWVSLSIRGLEVARVWINRRRIEFGIGDARIKLDQRNEPQLVRLIQDTISRRRPESALRNEIIFRFQPERWLESMISRDVNALDSTLDPRFVYSQVPTYRGEQRTFIDLLAATREGRLVVMELKVSEETEFPFQALDYWLRVEWHRSRGDFHRRGYFEGLSMIDAPPLLYLVAPLFRFHESTKLITASIHPRVPVYRIGVNEDWRNGVKVLLRERLN
ncbi:MAG TPA: hypothetical protein VLG74_06125 [Blastocatellia bacterium]|nr:hypothetical protein [Blastocatellia bacterium]